ncbi:DUF2807 domain-containing protein [Pedobacter nototheniae]|uniref:DUF2807 domain-containing protein n=1 Tax=Pedobacter nototheniae TaxID=2488994 RepID=UPI00292EA9AD|nr:DUF2807 domain-containing protein [Pedobacter nototheniae]
MKTSYRILIVLIILIVLSLSGFNLLMKSKYKKGDFAEELLPQKNGWKAEMTFKEVPAFKHLVINGAIQTSENKEMLWNPIYLVNSSANQKNSIGILKFLEPLLKYQISSDTLYLTLEKNRINEKTLSNTIYDPTFFLTVQSLQSVTIKNGTCRIDSLVANQSFKINTQNNSKFLINYLKTDNLYLDASGNSGITISNTWLLHNPITPKQKQSFFIANLYYHVKRPAAVYVEDTKRFGKILSTGPKGNQLEIRNEKLKIIEE